MKTCIAYLVAPRSNLQQSRSLAPYPEKYTQLHARGESQALVTSLGHQVKDLAFPADSDFLRLSTKGPGIDLSR